MARPPRLPDATILGLVAELRAQHAPLTGTRLRNELARRFGLRGGVHRVYRLLHQANSAAAAPSPTPPMADGEEPSAALAAALERARLAEHREEAHQARWAREVYELREQVRSLAEAARRAPRLEADLLDRSRELAAAYRRISDLEARLDETERPKAP